MADSKKKHEDFLVKLDQKHFLTKPVTEFLFPQKAVTPKSLIEIIEKNSWKD